MSDGAPDEKRSDVPEVERRRAGWAEFRHSYPGLIAVSVVALLALVAMNGWIVRKRVRYHAEIERLRGSMSDLERARADEILSQEHNKLRLAIQLLRRQAKLEKALHLSISVDTGAMYFEREGALLREMPVQIGPERRVGTAPDTVRLAAPRGVRTIARLLTDTDAHEMPAWVYVDRGIPVDSNRRVVGGLGPVAILLDGGTIIYSMPTVGPLNDSSYLLPGAVRARAADLRAILPNLSPGMRVYFY